MQDSSEWDRYNIKIKPLELILNILSKLYLNYGETHCFLTNQELIRIVIPLSGVNAAITDYCECLYLFKTGSLDLSDWPDCAPASNDKRMAREFLLFLNNYGYISQLREDGVTNETMKFILADISIDEIIDLENTPLHINTPEATVEVIRYTEIPTNIERRRISREFLDRPFQSQFRRNILVGFQKTCLVTGTNLENVLEAAHIKPVAKNGSDQLSNGLCLRTDIHRLYDSGHLKIFPDGRLILSDAVRMPNNYQSLPEGIIIPSFVDRENLNWRIKYA